MNIKSMRSIIEERWQEQLQGSAQGVRLPSNCLRCGGQLDSHMVINALSRYADVHICECCGIDEGMRDSIYHPLPYGEWDVLKTGSVQMGQEDRVILMAECYFPEVFTKTKKYPDSGIERPDSEIVYSRSDFDGHRWWTTWFEQQRCKKNPDIIKEIDWFQTALMEMKEFQNLDSMSRFCLAGAEHTKDVTEFNLYSETGLLYIWLRMINREKDYNLYVHYYEKS